MAPCPAGTVPEDVVSTIVLQKHGLIEDFRVSDEQVIQNIFEKLRTVPIFDKDSIFREGTDTLIGYAGISGAYIAEFIDGCSRFFYRMDPDFYREVIELIGKNI